MDKYEEALKEIRLFIHSIEGHGYGGTSEYEGLRPLIDLLDKAREKARKFDQLVEARKKATPGEWAYYKPLIQGHISEWGIESLSLETKVFYPTTMNEEDAAFITLAANLTREDA